MYHGDKNRSSQFYFFEFANNKNDLNLFYKFYPMIEDMIKEIVPSILNDYKEKMILNFETYLDGRKINLDGLKREIKKAI